MLPVVHEDLLQQERNIANVCLLRKRRALRVENSAFNLPNQRFIELFRLNKDLCMELIESLRPHLPQRLNVRGISVENMVLATLRLVVTGSYQRCVGEEYNFGMGQTTIAKYIKIVINAINDHIVDQKIQFPTEQERGYIRMEFLNKWGFPGTIGAIDGTHIAILKPSEESHNFLNRKGYYSINVQMVCDHEMKIRNVFANFGGASHDSFIWRNSQVNALLANATAEGERVWLVGDSGYPLTNCLMTPFRNPANLGEERFNRAHASARNIVERCFGVLKMRFRCLLREHTSRYSPNFVSKLIKVCAALHNICVDGNVHFEYEYPGEDQIIDLERNADYERNALNLRQTLVNNYFT